jgi:hypothetical protein
MYTSESRTRARKTAGHQKRMFELIITVRAIVAITRSSNIRTSLFASFSNLYPEFRYSDAEVSSKIVNKSSMIQGRS